VYSLSSRIPTRREQPDDVNDDARADLRFCYLAFYGKYVLIQNRRWQLSVPLQAGLGNAYAEYVSPDGSTQETSHDFMGVIEPSLQRLNAHFSLGRPGGGGRLAVPGFREPHGA